MSATFRETCPCGARFELEDIPTYGGNLGDGALSFHGDWLKRHSECVADHWQARRWDSPAFTVQSAKPGTTFVFGGQAPTEDDKP